MLEERKILAGQLSFRCNLCIFNFDTRAERTEHIKEHFERKFCTSCDKSLIQIGDDWFELQPHTNENCNSSPSITMKAAVNEFALNVKQIKILDDFSKNEENDSVDETYIEGDVSYRDELTTDNDSSSEERPNIKTEDVNLQDAPTFYDDANPVQNFTVTGIEHNPLISEWSLLQLTQENSIVCEFCQKILSNHPGNYRAHLLRVHSYVMPTTYTCHICNQTFDNKEDFNKHSNEVHEGKKLSCSECGKTFRIKRDLRRHEMMHTNGEHVSCDICKKVFNRKRSLINHMKNHMEDAKIQCALCDKMFLHRFTLKTHINVVHKGIKTAKCDICDKCFSTKTQLKNHLSTHSDYKPFICTYCGQGFKLKNTLEQHINIHTGIKPYTCQICNKGFSQKSLLTQHKRIHTREKKYGCNVGDCDRLFMNGTDAVRHRFNAHGVYTKRHICEICSAVFPEKQKLKKHIDKVHGVTN